MESNNVKLICFTGLRSLNHCTIAIVFMWTVGFNQLVWMVDTSSSNSKVPIYPWKFSNRLSSLNPFTLSMKKLYFSNSFLRIRSDGKKIERILLRFIWFNIKSSKNISCIYLLDLLFISSSEVMSSSANEKQFTWWRVNHSNQWIKSNGSHEKNCCCAMVLIISHDLNPILLCLHGK